MKRYTTLFIDLKNSRGYADEERYRIQVYMQRFIKRLNEMFEIDMEYPVVINAGDSMQGLFKNTTAALMYYRMFELLVYPVQIRAGIGIGEWNIKISEQDVEMDHITSTQQDGQTYHRAKQAILEVYRKSLHKIHICSECDDTFANYMINASMTMKEEHNGRQNQVLLLLELLYPFVKEKYDWTKTEIVDLLNLKLAYASEKVRRYETYAYFIRKERDNLKQKIESETNNPVDIQPIDLTKKDSENPVMEYKVNKPEEQEDWTIEYEQVPKEQVNPASIIYEPICIDGIMRTPERSIMKKRMAEQLAKILGCSRQNAASVMKSANALKIREMDYMALQYIEQHYRE